mmetsp:Transcript_28985/g.64833  ORF Transcript_28985/g.64833 Transcript_28985/m.64833 type:complete len:142 (-) Transcript_28985:197-622(-)
MLEWKKKAVDPDVRDETEKKKKPLSPPSLTRPHPPPHPFKARTNDGVRPIEVACAKNHSAVADLLLSKGVTSFVDPGLWMGLKMGSWMIRKQLPEVVERQRIADEEEAKAEAAFQAVKAEKERIAKEEKEAEAKKKKGKKK